MTFSLRGNSIPNDGSGRVLITNITTNREKNEDALTCHSDMPTDEKGNWYLHPTQQSIDEDDRIVSTDVSDRGWHRNRASDSEGHQIVRLRRDSSTALEGVFTCRFAVNNLGSVGIYYSSESV